MFKEKKKVNKTSLMNTYLIVQRNWNQPIELYIFLGNLKTIRILKHFKILTFSFSFFSLDFLGCNLQTYPTKIQKK